MTHRRVVGSAVAAGFTAVAIAAVPRLLDPGSGPAPPSAAPAPRSPSPSGAEGAGRAELTSQLMREAARPDRANADRGGAASVRGERPGEPLGAVPAEGARWSHRRLPPAPPASRAPQENGPPPPAEPTPIRPGYQLGPPALNRSLPEPGSAPWRWGPLKRVEALALEAEPAALDDDRLEMTSGRRRGRGSLRLPGAAAPLLRSGALRATVCVDRDGRPDHLEIDQGSGAAEVDRYVSRQLLSDRYQPLERDGRRMRFCERITVVFDRQT